MTEREELKPCPFCGDQPRIYGQGYLTNGECHESIDCDNSDCAMSPTTGYMKFDLAIAAWNRRAEG